MSIQNTFRDIGIIDDRYDVPGTYTYLPFGWAIRKRYVDTIGTVLEGGHGYEEMHFPDLISQDGIDTMSDSVLDVRSKVSRLSDFDSVGIAPTHEIPINTFLSNHIVTESQLPFKFFHTGTVYRKNNYSSFPYGLAEKRSFMEFHSAFSDYDALEVESEKIVKVMGDIINSMFMVPNIFSERPLVTNNPVSKRTLCYDAITGFGKTQISGMIYQHGDIFSRPFNVKYRENGGNKKKYIQTLHFGFTDNLLLSAITDGIEDGRLTLPDTLMPYQVGIIYHSDSELSTALEVQTKLEEQGIRAKLFCSNGKKSVYNLLEKQNPYFVIKIGKRGNITFSNLEGQDNLQYANDFGEYYLDKKDRRVASMLGKKEAIENARISKYGTEVSFEEINRQIITGKICDIPLLQDDSVVLDFEKNCLPNGEIIGFYDSQLDGKCLRSGKNTSMRAFLSKRF